MARQIRNNFLLWAALIPVLLLQQQNAAVAIVAVAIVWSLRSPFSTVQAMTVALFVGQFNFGNAIEFDASGAPIVESSSLVSGLKLVLLLVAFVRMVVERLLRDDHPPDRLLGLALLFAFATALLALATSQIVDVSLFKIAILIAGLTAVILAVGFARQDDRDALFLWFWCFLAAVVVYSAPLLPLPMGYIVNGAGFQGWTSQPQALGVLLAPATALFIGLAMFDRLWLRFNLPIGILAAVELLASQSRNALIAVIIGILAGLLISFRREPGRWIFLTFMGGVAALIVLALPSTQAYIATMLVKNDTRAGLTVTDAFALSRGDLIQRSLDNIAARPWAGIGFGIGSDPYAMVITRDPILGLPISAPVEKGVFWVGAVEEIGLIGFALFLALLWALLRGSLRQPSATAFAMALAALMTNNGEATLFSLGSLGLLVWLLLLLAYNERSAHG